MYHDIKMTQVNLKTNNALQCFLQIHVIFFAFEPVTYTSITLHY